MNVWDLLYLNAVKGWRERARVKACYMVELYTGFAQRHPELRAAARGLRSRRPGLFGQRGHAGGDPVQALPPRAPRRRRVALHALPRPAAAGDRRAQRRPPLGRRAPGAAAAERGAPPLLPVRHDPRSAGAARLAGRAPGDAGQCRPAQPVLRGLSRRSSATRRTAGSSRSALAITKARPPAPSCSGRRPPLRPSARTSPGPARWSRRAPTAATSPRSSRIWRRGPAKWSGSRT